MTDYEFSRWLIEGGRFTALVEVGCFFGGAEHTLYLSNNGYTTGPTETQPNLNHLPVVKGGLEFQTELSLQNSASMTWGDLQIDNTQGNLDDWLSYIWGGRTLRLYIGDASWLKEDFKLVFEGTLDGIYPSGRDTLNLKLRDKMQLLNTALTEQLIGGSSNNKDKLRPMLFGECHNIEPILIDPTTLRYKINDGAIERIIEVRDEGVPVTFNATLASGEFTLNASPVGAITVSAQGHKFSGTYMNTVADLIKAIVTTFGTSPLSIGDIDSTNFNAFSSANQQPIGIYLTSKENIVSLINTIADSVGAQCIFSPTGKLQLHKIQLPAGPSTSSITNNEIRKDSLSLKQMVDVQAGVKINYCKNWTVQDGLRSAIPEEHKNLFAKEWFESRSSDNAVATLYNIPKEPEGIETLLLATTDANAESLRRLNIYKEQRKVFTLRTGLSCFLTTVGSYCTLTNSRFGLSAGKNGQVISVSIGWMQREIEFGIIV